MCLGVPAKILSVRGDTAVIALGGVMLAYAEFVLSTRELFKMGLVSVLVGVMGLWVALRMRRLTGRAAGGRARTRPS